MTNWVSAVKTTTVNTPKGVMTKKARPMVATLLQANPDLPVGSIIRYVQFYLNRGGIGIPDKRRAEIEKAKLILQAINRGQVDLKPFLRYKIKE